MPESGPPTLSVIVAARDAASTLGRTLTALSGQELPWPFEVIVIDDASTDRTPEVLAAHPGVDTWRSPGPLGPGRARNVGVRLASGAMLAFTDADCVPARDWLRNGMQAMVGRDLVQGRVDPDPEADLGPFDRTLWVQGNESYFQTANLFVRRELFERLGGFSDLSPEGSADVRAHRRGEAPRWRVFGEDAAFGWRARQAGARIGFAPLALVHHAVFRRSAADYVRYRWRWRHFPRLVAAVPGIRKEFLHRGVFLSRRTEGFDLALAGLATGLVLRRWWPLLLTARYIRWVAHESSGWRNRRLVEVGTVIFAADLLTLAALLVGSASTREPVL